MSELLNEILENTSHHSFLIVGDRLHNFEMLRHGARGKVNAGDVHAADVWSRVYETVSIDDARELKEVQAMMPNGARRLVLVSLQTIQHEAQNSLLKLFEEPSSSTTFFMCVETTEILLPTLLSRFNIVELNPHSNTSTNQTQIDIKEFLAAPIAERMKRIEPITKEKDRAAAEYMLNGLEGALYNSKHKKAAAQIFEEIFSARRFLRSRSSSVKMILEHISGIIPVLSKEK